MLKITIRYSSITYFTSLLYCETKKTEVRENVCLTFVKTAFYRKEL